MADIVNLIGVLSDNDLKGMKTLYVNAQTIISRTLQLNIVWKALKQHLDDSKVTIAIDDILFYLRSGWFAKQLPGYFNGLSCEQNFDLIKATLYFWITKQLSADEIRRSITTYHVIIKQACVFVAQTKVINEALRMMNLVLPERLIIVWLKQYTHLLPVGPEIHPCHFLCLVANAIARSDELKLHTSYSRTLKKDKLSNTFFIDEWTKDKPYPDLQMHNRLNKQTERTKVNFMQPNRHHAKPRNFFEIRKKARLRSRKQKTTVVPRKREKSVVVDIEQDLFDMCASPTVYYDIKAEINKQDLTIRHVRSASGRKNRPNAGSKSPKNEQVERLSQVMTPTSIYKSFQTRPRSALHKKSKSKGAPMMTIPVSNHTNIKIYSPKEKMKRLLNRTFD